MKISSSNPTSFLLSFIYLEIKWQDEITTIVYLSTSIQANCTHQPAPAIMTINDQPGRVNKGVFAALGMCHVLIWLLSHSNILYCIEVYSFRIWSVWNKRIHAHKELLIQLILQLSGLNYNEVWHCKVNGLLTLLQSLYRWAHSLACIPSVCVESICNKRKEWIVWQDSPLNGSELNNDNT